MRIDENGLFVLPTDELARQQGYYLDFSLADAFEDFCRKHCRIASDDYSGEAGRTFDLSHTVWQRATARTALAWRKPNKELRFKHVFCYLPRRQGKTLLLAALSLFNLLLKKKSEVVIIAATVEQGEKLLDRARDFVLGDEVLSSVFEVTGTEIRSKEKVGWSKIGLMSSAKSGKGGRSITLCAFDEFCEWPQHSAKTVYDRMYSSVSDRPNSQIWSISTPQFDFTSLGRAKWLECKRILDSEPDEKSDLHTLPVLYGVPDDVDWQEPENWWKHIPSLGKTVDKAYYLEEYKKVKENPAEESRFRTMELGQWVGSPTVWIPFSTIMAGITNVPESKWYGREIIIGADVAKRLDLTAYCNIIEDNGTFYFYPRIFIPRDIAQQRQDQDNVPYLDWARQGFVELTPGDVVDYVHVRNRMMHDAMNFRVKEIRYDDYGTWEETRQVLAQKGFNTVAVSNHVNTMSPAFNEFQRLMMTGKAKFPNNPCFLWCLGNCKPELDKHDRLMVEKSSDTQRIDPVDAACIGLTWWLDKNKNMLPVCPEGQKWAMTW